MQLISVLLLLLLVGNVEAQTYKFDDYFINAQGDTVKCHIAESPREEGLRYERGKVYYHDYVQVVIESNDRLKRFSPADIKAYRIIYNKREDHIPGLYYSKNVYLHFSPFREPKGKPVQKFVKKLIRGGRYNLWFFEDYVHDGNDRLFILEDTKTKKEYYIMTTSQLRKVLSDWPDSQKSDKRYRNWYTGKQWLVIDYNNWYKKNNQ